MLSPSSSIRLLLVACLILALSGWSPPQLRAEDRTADAIQFVTPNSTATQTDGVDALAVFAGTTLTCRWLIREPAEKPLRASLDVFQAMSATAVPIHRDITLLEDAQVQTNRPLEAIYQFEVPPNDRPVRYVLRMTVSADGKPVGSARLLVRAEPSDKLTGLADTKITLVGFPSDETSWRTCLDAAGVTLVTKTADDIKKAAPDEIGAIFFLASKATPLPAHLKNLAINQRVTVFQNNIDSPRPTICRPAGDGWIVYSAISLLDHLADSPDAQDQLLHLLTDDFTNPTADRR